MTLYRLARHSKVVEALIEAAENGKQVDVLVELKTRFDEENNIEWSRQLEDAGCHVIYGLDGLKVHSKLCLITRKTEKGIDYITQIGTGNRGSKSPHTGNVHHDAKRQCQSKRAAAGRHLCLFDTGRERSPSIPRNISLMPLMLQRKIIISDNILHINDLTKQDSSFII